ncbi:MULTISPECIES: hypothetical protein [Proteus]|uniref:hypothetical protein n=1 Tax=Proteus TaxID=583 RepID=UPI000C9F5692|nr:MULTISPECIES: hypothetical protein [Proteus]UBH60618.1 hypothetical protein LA322_10830 [Proteus vulgaris]VTP85119.1 Uncharacterised protein [Proteus vulgaris]
MDKSRQQFEEWFNDEYETTMKDYDEPLIEFVMKQLFIVWQASRESLAIELPEPFIANENCETWCYDEDLVNQTLISNGVKIKNE